MTWKCTAHLTGAACEVRLATVKSPTVSGFVRCARQHQNLDHPAFCSFHSTEHPEFPTVFQLHFATKKVIQENLAAQDVINNLNVFYEKPKIIMHINVLPQPR